MTFAHWSHPDALPAIDLWLERYDEDFSRPWLADVDAKEIKHHVDILMKHTLERIVSIVDMTFTPKLTFSSATPPPRKKSLNQALCCKSLLRRKHCK